MCRFKAHAYWATVCKTVHPMLLIHCLSVCAVCLSVTFVYCGQTVAWIKMKLGIDVGLGPTTLSQIGTQLPLPRGTAPNFRPDGPKIGGKRWLDQDAIWYGCTLRPRQHCVTWGPSSPFPKGVQPPIFGLCLLWPNGWMESWGCVPLGKGELGPHLTQCHIGQGLPPYQVAS